MHELALTSILTSISILLLLRQMCSIQINMDRKAECEVWTDIMLQREEMAPICKV